MSIVGGVLGGKWVQDHWTHWEPWTLLLGLLFGCIAAMRALMRTSRQWQREIAQNEAEAAEGKQVSDDDSAAANLLMPMGGLRQLWRLREGGEGNSGPDPDPGAGPNAEPTAVAVERAAPQPGEATTGTGKVDKAHD